jgi:hypothetical protein
VIALEAVEVAPGIGVDVDAMAVLGEAVDELRRRTRRRGRRRPIA